MIAHIESLRSAIAESIRRGGALVPAQLDERLDDATVDRLLSGVVDAHQRDTPPVWRSPAGCDSPWAIRVIHRPGWSARVSAVLVMPGGARIDVAQVGAGSLTLAAPLDRVDAVGPGWRAVLIVSTDGVDDVTRIVLPDGMQAGQREVRIEDFDEEPRQ